MPMCFLFFDWLTGIWTAKQFRVIVNPCFCIFCNVQLMIGGLGKIDVDDWKRNTRLKHCSTETNIVRWFWRVVDEYDEEHRARLLQFVTGSSRVPLQGFKSLQGNVSVRGIRSVNISVYLLCCVVFVICELALFWVTMNYVCRLNRFTRTPSVYNSPGRHKHR